MEGQLYHNHKVVNNRESPICWMDPVIIGHCATASGIEIQFNLIIRRVNGLSRCC